MRNLFLFLLAILVIFSQVMVHRNTSESTGARVLYWVTDPNPARYEQILLFKQWLSNRGEAPIDIRLDTANQGIQKTVLQGVTGVAGDLIDAGGGQIPMLQSMGLLADLTPLFVKSGLPAFDTYPALRDELVIDDKTYGTPCNAWVDLYLVNAAAFQAVGCALPPTRWTLDEFETHGKDFVAGAQKGGKRRQVYFANRVDPLNLYRSSGLPRFNETLTLPWGDIPGFARVNRLIHKWTYADHIIPSEADLSSLSTDQGYGSADFQLFHAGYFGLLWSGRHALIQLRQMSPALEYGASEHPHGGFPNVRIGTRAVVLYQGSRHKDLAALFLAFLRGEGYNRSIALTSDALPPMPGMLDRPEMLSPVGYTNEWKLHREYARMAREIAIGSEVSPYLPPNLSSLKLKAFQGYMSGVGTAESAARDVHDGTLEEISNYVGRSFERRKRWLQDLEVQNKLDGMKSRNEILPLSLIKNPFLRRYYSETGRAR